MFCFIVERKESAREFLENRKVEVLSVARISGKCFLRRAICSPFGVISSFFILFYFILFYFIFILFKKKYSIVSPQYPQIMERYRKNKVSFLALGEREERHS